MNNSLGILLRNYRKEHNLTQSDMADRLGIACNSYQRYEEGIGNPSFEMFVKILDCCEFSMAELSLLSSSKDTGTSADAETLAELLVLLKRHPEQMDPILEYLRAL